MQTLLPAARERISGGARTLARVCLVSIASLIGVVALPAASPAAEPVVDVTPAVVLAAAKAHGKARLVETKPQGTPVVMGQIGSRKYLVFLVGCANQPSCKMVQLRTLVPAKRMTVEHVNNWNILIPIGTAILQDDRVILRRTIITEHGLSKSTLEGYIGAWGRFLKDVPKRLKEAREP